MFLVADAGQEVVLVTLVEQYFGLMRALPLVMGNPVLYS